MQIQAQKLLEVEDEPAAVVGCPLPEDEVDGGMPEPAVLFFGDGVVVGVLFVGGPADGGGQPAVGLGLLLLVY